MTDRSEESKTGPVEADIRSVASLEKSLEAKKTLVDRVADVIGGFSGSMSFVGLHLLWFTLWFVINTGHMPGVKKFDPYPFIFLSMAVSVEAVLLSTFVLMKQNQMQRKIDHRDELNLQIDLLSEKEITKTLQILNAICVKLEIGGLDKDSEFQEMSKTTSIGQLGERIAKEVIAPDKSP